MYSLTYDIKLTNTPQNHQILNLEKETIFQIYKIFIRD